MTSVKEWIDDKIKNGDIDYFEYDEFNSNIVEIGKGGFGKVSKAELPSMGLEVALKSSIYENSEIEENYINNLNELVKELKLLYKVRHPNINRFLGITKDHKKNYVIVLEYANEKDLKNYLKTKFTSLEWKDKIQMALDITCGLKYLHSKDIIHRDLHSKNILVNRGILLIADLGLSKQLTEVTSTNSMANRMGIYGYVEPQCFKDPSYKKDKKSDIYSLGVLFWEISSGRPPFFDIDPVLVIVKIINGNRENPIDGTTLEYQQLYQKCWSEEPGLRPNIEEVHKTLTELKSKFDPVESQATQDLGSLNNNNECSYSDDLKINFVVDENLNQNQEFQKTQNSNNLNINDKGSLKNSSRDYESGNKIVFKQKKDAQKWFNNKFSQKKESIIELKILDKYFDSSLKIDSFTKLEIIDLKIIKLTSLKIINCSQLTKIDLSEFTFNLEISCCSELIEVKLSKCRIKSLSVSECPKLTKLDCPSCELTELDISNIIELDCSGNKIKYLNLNLCPKITALNCSNNQLNTLELSNCSKLEVLNYHNNQLTSLDISHCPKLKDFTKKFSNPNIDIFSEQVTARNLLIIGRTGGGKSTLSNVLSDSEEFKESGYSVSETKNFQKAVFKWNGTNYRVVDTIGVGDTKLTKKVVLYKIMEGIYSMPEGISQILFVFNGRFTAEELEMFRLFEEVIFESGVVNYTTIVRTKFDQFQIKEECEKDTHQLLKETRKIAEIVKSCSIVHVDNPSTNIARDDDYQIRMQLNRKRREMSRIILLNHLEEACNKENYKFKTWDELRDDITSYLTPNFIISKEGKAVRNLLTVGSTDSGKENNKAQKWFNKKYSQKKESIDKLRISDKHFDNSLKIDGFMKLETIYLTNLKLTSLKMSNCSQLTEISLELTLSTNLEISHCSELIEIKLSKCRIKRLFVSDCPKIKKLDCPSCELTELDISNIIELDCSGNKIKYLNLNLCPKITALNCSNNQLNTLEISNCSNLEVLDCHKNQLTSLDISNCPKLKNPEKSENFITTSNPNLIISENGKAASNLLIVGRTGGGKSTLSNVLSNSDEFKESSYSISETKNFRRAVFQWNGTNYRVVDTIGVGDTKLTKKKVLYKIAEGIYSMPEGISQILFVFNGRFTAEELEMFRLFEEVIFESGVVNYTTIVRTKFDQFQIKEECEKDRNKLLKETRKIAEIVKSCSIVHVDNPSTNIARDDDYQIRMELNRKRREMSRIILLNHLEEACNKENYKFKTWDKLRVEIDDYMKKIESDKEAVEEMKKIDEVELPLFLKRLLTKLA